MLNISIESSARYLAAKVLTGDVLVAGESGGSAEVGCLGLMGGWEVSLTLRVLTWWSSAGERDQGKQPHTASISFKKPSS